MAGNNSATADDAARWRSIVDSAVDGIIVIDSRALIEEFNPAAERLFGYAEAEVVGRNVNLLMPSPYHEEHDGYLQRYLQTGAKKIIGIGREVTGKRKDGTTFPLHLSVGELRLGDEQKFTGIVHDLTERVQLEERLRASEERWRAVVARESVVTSANVAPATKTKSVMKNHAATAEMAPMSGNRQIRRSIKAATRIRNSSERCANDQPWNAEFHRLSHPNQCHAAPTK